MYENFAALYDPLMGDVDYNMWADYIASFLPEGRLNIVDCGCGTGEITLRLAGLGHQLTGVDISEEMLMIAAQKARKAARHIPFVRQDMRKLSLHRKVDAVVSACDGVNYLLDSGEVREFLDSAFRCLKPGGMLLFDISSEYKLSHILGCNTFAEDDGERAYIWKNCYDPQSRLVEMELSFFVREGEQYRRFQEIHIQRAHIQAEITELMGAAGFEPECYEAFSRDAVGEETERIQFVGRKPL